MSRLKTLVRNETASPPLRGGHALCQGCGIPLVVRTVLDSIDDAGGRRLRDGLSRSGDDALPDHSVERPWLHVAFENSAAVASGIESA